MSEKGKSGYSQRLKERSLEGGNANQLQLFADLAGRPKPKSLFQDLATTNPENQETNSAPKNLPTKEKAIKITNRNKKSRVKSEPSKKKTSSNERIQQKFQVSNGYLLECDQLARILHFMLENQDVKKISRKVLFEDTGLADRQVESLVSMGAAMGLIKPGNQVLTPVGLLMAKNDIFVEKMGSLEWLHYVGAGSYRNLFWFEVFNDLLTKQAAMTQDDWQDYFRKNLRGRYSDKTIKKHLPKEIRFIVDAYMDRNFNKLDLLQKSPDERLYRRRYTGFNPLVLTAMIYDFCTGKETPLSQVGEMATQPGSPAMVFGLDVTSFRRQIEDLHDRGWLRYETTHNLDQIRLKPGFSTLEFLTAYFSE